jgi:hypothetical protein
MGRIYTALGLSTKPRWDNDGEPMGGDNECYSLKHDNPNGKLRDAKYRVGKKEYMVGGASSLLHQHKSLMSSSS